MATLVRTGSERFRFSNKQAVEDEPAMLRRYDWMAKLLKDHPPTREWSPRQVVQWSFEFALDPNPTKKLQDTIQMILLVCALLLTLTCPDTASPFWIDDDLARHDHLFMPWFVANGLANASYLLCISLGAGFYVLLAALPPSEADAYLLLAENFSIYDLWRNYGLQFALLCHILSICLAVAAVEHGDGLDVSGTAVDVAKAAVAFFHGLALLIIGATHYFVSRRCKAHYHKTVDEFIKAYLGSDPGTTALSSESKAVLQHAVQDATNGPAGQEMVSI
jgi:hypothetical protein